MATSVPGHNSCHLFYITDSANDLHFLVDTGAEVSVVPPSQTDRKRQASNLSLQAVNNTAITTYGNRL